MYALPNVFAPRRVYAGRQVVNARFVALLQPDAADMPGYSNRLRDVRPHRAKARKT